MKRNFKKIFVVLFIFFLTFLVYISFFSGSSNFNIPFLNTKALKSTDNRVNVLLLGIGGAGHEGPDLTDSIIVASYNLKTHNITLFSVPRDLWLGNIREKANAAYEKGGLSFVEDKIDDILGIPIHYGVVLDFSGFAKAIDLVGGVDVKVERAFDDYIYPIEGKENDLCNILHEEEKDLTDNQASVLGINPGKQKVLVDSKGEVATDSADPNKALDYFPCRFEHIHFDSGLTHMDGTEALKYVRSRHGTNEEGSDFARSKRQQLVIGAFRIKLLSFQTLTNPQKISELVSTFGKSIQTDIPKEHFLDFYSLTKKVSKINSVVLGDLGNSKSLFVNPPPSQYGGAWVLIPPDEDLSLVVDYVKKTLEQDK